MDLGFKGSGSRDFESSNLGVVQMGGPRGTQGTDRDDVGIMGVISWDVVKVVLRKNCLELRS